MRHHFPRSNFRDQDLPDEVISHAEDEDWDDVGASSMETENMGVDEDSSSDFSGNDDSDTDVMDTDSNSETESESEPESDEDLTSGAYGDESDSNSNYDESGEDDSDSDSVVGDAGKYTDDSDDEDGSESPEMPPGTVDSNHELSSMAVEGRPLAIPDHMDEVSTGDTCQLEILTYLYFRTTLACVLFTRVEFVVSFHKLCALTLSLQ
ncbi:hypothetical protein Q9L58_006524 [Maublancomyces gigas]|uniref:Uncharacterized protein n=1 Tax=Discina gigas TaxID=1032678 RepID=A0ABR3GF60_9PEZI